MTVQESISLCCISCFVCRFDALPAAKRRYLERLRETRKKYEVVLASEQVYNLGQSDMLFELLLKEIVAFGEPLSEEEKEEYSTFMVNTIVSVPKNDNDDAAWELIDLLEMDYADEFPAVFPSHTRVITMSPTGQETPGFTFQ